MQYVVISIAEARAHGIEILPTQRQSNDKTKAVIHANMIAGIDVFNQLKRYRFDDSEFIELLNSPEWTPDEGAETPDENFSKVRALQILNTETKEDINTMSISDEDSLQVKEFYPEWSEFVGKELPQGYKVNYNGNLYKVIQAVNPVLEHQTPDLVPANYNVINEENKGTEDDPIPYVKPMVVYEGKYYTYEGVKYKCIRDSGNALQYTPDQLTGQYFEVSESPVVMTVSQTSGESFENITEFVPPMPIENGKLYRENGIVYRCTQTSRLAISNKLSDLVGYYVEIYK